MESDIAVDSTNTEKNEADGFKAYCQYVALKAHFNQGYDWKKYQGKLSIPLETYIKRKDKIFFQIIESKFSPPQRNQIFLANFVYNKHLWIGELLAENCIGIWNDWKGRISRMDYQFEEDVKNALDEVKARKKLNKSDALKFLISKPNGTHPLVLRFVWGGMFHLESYLLLSVVLNLRNVYSSFLPEDKLWADFESKVEKYENLLSPKLNIPKTKQTLIQIVKE